MQLSADVLACNVNPDTNMVEVLDTWNTANERDNIPDDIMDAFMFSGDVQNGRIVCRYMIRYS